MTGGLENVSDTASFQRLECDFQSQGVRCSAWLYLPDGEEPPPVVIMAHGFGAYKSFKLPAYAEQFARAGMAALVFDYRNLGDSDGAPRNLVSHSRHIADWAAAIAHVKTLSQVDSSRIALWGTSFSGGHVIVTAARHSEIKAIVSQVPCVDVTNSLGGFGLGFTLTSIGHGLRDVVQSALTGKPHLVPIVAERGKFSILHADGCFEGYRSTVPAGAKWDGSCPARVLLTSTVYRATTFAGEVRCPALMIIAKRDQICPAELARQAAAKMAQCQTIEVDGDHFAAYQGEEFVRVSRSMTEFLACSLQPGHGAAAESKARSVPSPA